jgi:Transposase DDE domain
MDRDHFIILVYCLVCEHYQAIMANHSLRQRGFAPALSDEEVITMEICGEYFGFSQDEAIYNYFRAHYQPFFPKLKDRTLFVRQAANLWWIKASIQYRLTGLSGQRADPVQPIDTLPLPVCVYTRSQRDRCFKPEADYSYCAAKDMPYYGFKLGLRISRSGMILDSSLLPARPHDSQLLDDLIESFEGMVPADKAFIDAFRQEALARKRNVALVTPVRKNMKVTPPIASRRICNRWRKLIETVGSHLTERYQIAKTRARDLWHYQHRLIRKVLSHTVCVFINLQLGRSSLDLDDLVIA